MTTYKIVRMYSRLDGGFNVQRRTIERGLTLQEAQEHCGRPDTSSHGKLDPRKGNRAWFDGYEEDR